MKGKNNKQILFFFSVFFVLVFISTISCVRTKSKQNILFTYVDPLQKVFKETAFFPQKEPVADVARGEHASFQFVFRSDKSVDITDIAIQLNENGRIQLGTPVWGFVEYVRIGRKSLDPASDRLYSISGYYPDPIIKSDHKKLSAEETQPIWVTIPVPKSAKPGTYTGTIYLKAKQGLKKYKLSKDFAVHVYPPIINKTSLWVTNWYGTDFSFLNEGKSVVPFSAKYWKYMRMLARIMARYNQNVALISPLKLANYNIEDNLKYSIDFSNFIKTVKIFEEEGVVGRIEGGHIGTRDSTWSSPFVVLVPVQEKDTIILRKFSIKNDTARIFYKQFFPKLMKVLDVHGWKDIYMQHIADEPIESNAQSYINITKFVKTLIPDIPIIEACHTTKVKHMISVWVPQLNFFNADYHFYSDRQKKGDEVWFYTCLGPKGEFANRFIDLPLIKTRILHWINFKYHAPGYLHWGFNHWNVSGNPYNETTGINKESGNILPGGDAWIVYPGKDTIYSSIRLEAMRDGIVDYELLKMLKEKDPENAADFSHQVVYGFHTYETNIDAFRAIRKRLLELLSGVH